MKKSIIVISVALLVILGACKKPYEYEEPKITETSVTIKGPTSVEFRAGVNFAGEMDMVVEWSTHSDMSESQRHSMYRDGESHFSQTIVDLEFGKKYYYRFKVSNPNFSLSTETDSFRIKECYLSYGDGYRKSSWGYKENSFTLEWAVMFPANMLTSFSGASITKVRINVGETGRYTLTIYKGGTYSPSTYIKSKSFDASSGWKEISISPLALDVNSSLWISVSTSMDGGNYPASTSKGINYINARWVRPNGGSWMDGKDWANDGTDLCWMIQAFVTLDSKGEKGLEMELPLSPMGQGDEICAEISNVGVECVE